MCHIIFFFSGYNFNRRFIFIFVFILQGSGASAFLPYAMISSFGNTSGSAQDKIWVAKGLFWCVAALSSKPLIIKTI